MSDDAQVAAAMRKYANWQAAGETRRRSGRTGGGFLAPWDELQWFDLPIDTRTILPGSGAWTSVLLADPNRVVIIFSPNSAGAYYLTVDSSKAISQGLEMVTTGFPLIITQAESGPFCQCQWFASSTTLITVSVLSVRLREMPR